MTNGSSTPTERGIEGNEEIHGQSQLEHSSAGSGADAPLDENEEMVITSIRATDVAAGLRRFPAGFYVSVQHDGREWRTENKPASVIGDVVEWGGPIPIPSTLSATVSLGIYASFEFQPMLGNGEALRKLSISVEQLLACSAKGLPFTFFPDDGDVVSPCSSLSVTVGRWKRDGVCSSVSRVIDPYRSTTESLGELEEATNHGHIALSRYRKYGEKRDLERSIERFERALDVCPVSHPCRVPAQTNIAMAQFIHCWAYDTDLSLDVPLALYNNALIARPLGHPDRSSTLIQLAFVHMARFEKRGDEVDATQAEGLLREAMDLGSAESHENQVASFVLRLQAGRKTRHVPTGGQSSVGMDVGSSSKDQDKWAISLQLLQRFERLGMLADLQQAISLLEASISSIPVSDHRYPALLSNLSVAFSYRFRHLGELSDLEQAISRQQEALDRTPGGHPNKSTYLNNLGNSFKARFERLGKFSDLDQTISSYTDSVNLIPDGDPNKPRRLNNLGNNLRLRFERLGELKDLEHAISRYRDAINLTNNSHPSRPDYLSNLGNCLVTRFERLGHPNDLEQAILRHKDAVNLTPDGHLHKSTYLNNLANDFIIRYQRFSERNDLEQAISNYEDSLNLTPYRHPLRLHRLASLCRTLKLRFERVGDLNSLEQAILRYGDGVQLTPDSHPGKPNLLYNLGNALLTRFHRLGELGDLEQATLKLRDAVELTPDDHHDKHDMLNSLGNTFKARFDRLGELSDIQQAISWYSGAVDLSPSGHPNRPVCLGNLGRSYQARFGRLGERSDLEQASTKYKDAIDLIPDGHPDRPRYLINAANCAHSRFEHFGELSDLEQAISGYRDAVDLTPNGHPDKAHHLNNLANCFITRFERTGELSDLEQAVLRQRDAVDLIPDGDPHKPRHLSNLASSVHTRFERLGEPSDLELAISKHRDAVELTPDGDPDKPRLLCNLGNSLLTRFQRFGEPADLEQAISMHGDAVNLVSDAHPSKSTYLNNLGNSLKTRFEHLGEPRDLEQAISKYKVVVGLTFEGHPHKASYLNNLASSFLIHFKRVGELSSLQQAISHYRDAIAITPDDHTNKPAYLRHLGNALRTRFERLGELSDLEQAISLYSDAACSSVGPTTVRFRASQQWISCARVLQHHSLLNAYSVAISLLPQLAWIGLSLSRRYSELVKGTGVVREAAAAALDSGHLETAVEWLEQGRSIVWGELFQLRSSYDELASVHPDHARRLRELSTAVENASASHEKSLSSLSEQARHVESLGDEADTHRALAIERDRLLREIRGLPGLERFLLHKEFSQLRALAHSGPVVILNAAQTRCDGLIILVEVDHIVHVPLPDITLERLKGLQNTLKSLLGPSRDIHDEERVGKRAARVRISWESLLSILWNTVVKPILDALDCSTPGNLRRVFWCPTGPFTFLPIHAAGHYGANYSEPGHKVSDFVISSYIPTLSILSPESKPSVFSSEDLRLIAVRQPSSDGQSQLPGVDTELKYIRAVIQNSPSAQTTLVESSIGTVEEVLTLMKDADWVHFACHGVQDAANPTDSGLCLADQRRLKLSNIISISRPRGGLAFLSACQTATGDKDLSDEAIHIAAGMLFAGYESVVGTMWSISDRLAPLVARDVYAQLFRHDKRPDYREAARALQDAVGRLRDANNASFVEWLPFIHVGL